MSEVLFYHLTQTPLEATLPELLQKSRARGWKAVVRGKNANRLSWLDERLWLGGDTSFLAHGQDGGAFDADQPILLTLGHERANDAEILFAIDGATISAEEVPTYSRVCLLFDGNDPVALDQARGQWKHLTDAGLPAKYWSQETGNWQMKVQKN